MGGKLSIVNNTSLGVYVDITTIAVSKGIVEATRALAPGDQWHPDLTSTFHDVWMRAGHEEKRQRIDLTSKDATINLSDIFGHSSEFVSMPPLPDLNPEVHAKFLEEVKPTGLISKSQTFRNFCRTVDLTRNVDVFEVSTIPEVQRLMRAIHSVNQSEVATRLGKIVVRSAAGSSNADDKNYFYSFSLSRCVEAHVIIRLVGDLGDSGPVTVIDQSDGTGIAAVPPNQQLLKVETELWQQGYFFPSTPLIPYVTFNGIVGNSGHGTGKDQPALAGFIHSIDFVRPDGELVKMTEGDPHFENVARCHFGLVGVITGLTIRVQKRKKLAATRLPVNFSQLLKKIEKGLFTNNAYTTVMYMPTYLKNEFTNDCPANVQVITGELVDDASIDKNLPTEAEKEKQAQAKAIIDAISKTFHGAVGRYLVPAVMGTAASVTIRRDPAEGTDIVGPFYEASHYISAYPWALDDLDVLVPIQSSKDILDIMNELKVQLEKRSSRVVWEATYPVIDAIYLRFIKGTKGGLSTSQDIQSGSNVIGYLCLDVVSDPDIYDFQGFKWEMQEFLISKGGKPHWGKYVDPSLNYPVMYGERMIDFVTGLTSASVTATPVDQNPFANPFAQMVLKTRPSDALRAVVREALPAEEKRDPATAIEELKQAQLNLAYHVQHFLLPTIEKNLRVGADTVARASLLGEQNTALLTLPALSPTASESIRSSIAGRQETISSLEKALDSKSQEVRKDFLQTYANVLNDIGQAINSNLNTCEGAVSSTRSIKKRKNEDGNDSEATAEKPSQQRVTRSRQK